MNPRCARCQVDFLAGRVEQPEEVGEPAPFPPADDRGPVPKHNGFSGATHFNWFGPEDAGRGVSGQYALAFQKVFLEGDERWRPILKMMASGGTVNGNIQ